MIGRNCIVRLSRYKNALYQFKKLGVVKIFSDNLAEAVNVTASQVRKDFSIFGISGNKRGGYQVEVLIEQLKDILGKNEVQKAVIVGAGNIGRALMNYTGFEKEGITIVAAFDIDPHKFNEQANVPIFGIDKLNSFISNNKITIGIIAVPAVAAQQVLDLMEHAGVKGVLNFAPISLRANNNIVVNNINLELELENLIYYINASARTKE
ncbi:MAG: redox-sensing transcriptional repressor Rex [Candidatus Omnitrophica bacterium]|nr:redox-sensing transcriptional repressor Rex [Candidatus Omnitrophota bacterium]